MKLFSKQEIIFRAGILFFVIINFSEQDCSERIVFGYLALGLIKYTGSSLLQVRQERIIKTNRD